MNSKNDCHIARIIPSILFFLFLSVAGCDRGSESVERGLDSAEYLMESRPDSALAIIDLIDESNLKEESQKARYALLKSMALDKNYVDTTTFDVLQPAIDYYLKKGTPDERLRTYYYQGRIYQNKNERDKALYSFIKGLDNVNNCKDSMTMARSLVAQAVLYYGLNDLNRYMYNYEKAADIYRNKAYKDQEFDCLLNILIASIALKQQRKADSLLSIINHDFTSPPENQNNILLNYKLAYSLQFESNEDIKYLVDHNGKSIGTSIDGVLNLASAYNRLGDNDRAVGLLDFVKRSGISYDTLKYLAKSVSILKDGGNYKDAFSVYWRFNQIKDSINALKYEQNVKTVEEKHQIELQSERESQKNFKMMCVFIGGFFVLGLVVVILSMVARSNKIQRVLAMQKARTAELENEKLKSESEKLSLENANLQLERDKKALEAENLAHRVEVLENESESLKGLLDTPEEIPAEVQQAIRTRIEMLNSLLAGYITENARYEEPYDAWVKQLTDNTEAFMDSNRLAFQASHPRFIRYFEDHGLTESEINYVCLYAIGLRGKEVGNYMKKRSHVNTSSDIRKKLGIDKHETNIGIYVRKLLKEL